MKRTDKGPLGGPDKKKYKNSVFCHKRAWRDVTSMLLIEKEKTCNRAPLYRTHLLNKQTIKKI